MRSSLCWIGRNSFRLQQLHLTTAAIWQSALVVLVLVFAGMGVGFASKSASTT